MFYNAGMKIAADTLGLRNALLELLQSPRYGEFASRIPIQAAVGGLGGLGTGLLMGSEHPGEQTAWGAGMGAAGGAAVAAAPQLREAMIRLLSKH